VIRRPSATSAVLTTAVLTTAAPVSVASHPAVEYLNGLFREDDFIFIQLIHATQTHTSINKRTGKPFLDKDGNERRVADTNLLPLIKVVDATTPGYIDSLQAFQDTGWNVYVCMNPFPAGTTTRTEALITTIRTLYLDVDKTKENGDRALQLIEAAVKAGLIPQPTSILESSPGNYHITWAVRDFTPAQAKAMLPVMASRLGGDMAAIDLNRVLRLPGFKNLKKGREGFTCRLVSSLFGEIENPSYSFSDFKLPIVVEERKKTKPSPEAVEATVGYMTANAAEAQFELGDEDDRADGGVNWIIDCPWKHLHTQGGDTAMLMVLGDGRPEFNCFHGHCNGEKGPKRGWSDIRNLWKEKVGHFQRFGPEVEEKAISSATPNSASASVAVAGVGKRPSKKDYTLDFKKEPRAGGAFEFVLGRRMGANEGWFPLGDPSLIAGPSGGSKSTLMIDLLQAQFRKESFLGHDTFGRPYLILMADRGNNAHARTAERMHFNPNDIPIKFLSLEQGEAAVQAILARIEECDPLPHVVFIEGADLMVENASKMELVGPFMSALQKIARRYHIAIVASVGSAKQKVGEGYTSKRDHVFGSIAWSRMSDTVAIIQYVEGDDMDNRRILSVLPRNSAPEKYRLVLTDGRLIPDNTPEGEAEASSGVELAWFREQTDWFTTLDVVRALKVGKTTAYRYVEDAAAKHILVTRKKVAGEARQYRWNDSDRNPLKQVSVSLNEGDR
jgi:RepB DNA-primase from phage plasmid/AAA domain